MPVMNFDLEDGHSPVSFTLKHEDAERFMDFMQNCHDLEQTLDNLRRHASEVEDERDALASPDRDMVAHMHRQIAFSTRAFGPGDRHAGVIDHIRKELHEIEEAPHDLEEWIDVVLLALDGAWRSGHSAEEVVAMLDAKLTKNESREWPDWRTADRSKAIEHDRAKDREAS